MLHIYSYCNFVYSLFIVVLVSNIIFAGKKIVITGAPGAGKTTLINFLKKENYQIISEVYTTTIEKALADGTDKDLVSDPLNLKYLLMHKQLELESQLDTNRIAFLDRSTIDLLMFFKFDIKIDLPQDFIDLVAKSKYDIAFIMEPLPEPLFSLQLKTRTKYAACDRDTSLEIAKRLRAEYLAHGIPCIDVPFDTTEQMAAFIKDTIEKID